MRNEKNIEAGERTHEDSKPNTVLPKGAKAITPPVKMKLDAWTEQEVDATVQRHGLTWYRVKGGMGGRGDREDWVADVPAVCISVHDYHYNGEDFGPNHGSFDNACLQEARKSLEHAKEEREENMVELKAINKALAILERV